MQLTGKFAKLAAISLILAGCATGRTAFDKGQKLEKAGDLDQAVIKYAQAAAANPEMGEYRLKFLKAGIEAAKMHAAKGDDFFGAKKYDEALKEYQTASALDPSQERSRQRSEEVRKLRDSDMFLKEGAELESAQKPQDALRSYKKAYQLNPQNTGAKEAIDRLTKAKKPKLEGYELNLKSNKPITLKFKDAKLKDVFNILTQLSGINFIFDEAVKDQNFSIYLENASFQQALDVITELNKLGKKVLNESSIIIYPKTSEKNKQYDELYIQTFYLNKIDAKKAINLLRTMMQIKKIYVNEELNAIVIRDTPEVVELASKILEANDIPDAEVVLEVEVIELSKKNEEDLGFILSRYAVSTEGFNNGTPFSDVLSTTTATSSFGTTTTTSSGPSSLLQLFAWRQFSGFLTVPNATFNFAKTLSNGETLANPKIRIKNREKSKFNVGTRVPITTTSSPTGGGVNVNVQYVDVGVKLNAEPTIQLNDDVSIKLSMEVSSILSRDTVGGSGSATTVVTIGTRNLDTVLSLKDGETSIIGGLIQDAKSKSKQKIAVLGDIPVIGPLLSGSVDTNDKTELVLAITPHIVRGMTIPDPNISAFWSGKEDEPSTVKLFSSFNPEASVQNPEASAPVPAKPAPSAGPVQGLVPPPAIPPSVAQQPAYSETKPPAPAVPAMPTATPQSNAPASIPGAPTSTVAAQQLPAAPAPSSRKLVLDVSAPPSAKVGEQFQVEVIASDANNLYNAPMSVEYDPALVDFVGATEGAFLKRDGKPTMFETTVKREAGEIDLNMGRVGAVGGVSGSGTLAVLTFKAKAKGEANYGFGAANLKSADGASIEIDLRAKVVEVK